MSYVNVKWQTATNTADDQDLARRQEEHLNRARQGQGHSPRACAHNQCSQCIGTGIKRDGSLCVHMISCSCRRCAPWA